MPIQVTQHTQLPVPDMESMAAPPATGGPPWVDVAYVCQSEDNWCWAACGEMLFPPLGRAHLVQCDFASHKFNLTCCTGAGTPGGCPSPGTPDGCNKGAWPDFAYPPLGLPTNFVNDQLKKEQVRAELSAGKPVQVCYEWTEGKGRHVALIVGEHPGGKFEVFDPAYGQGPREFESIQSAYEQGKWIFTFTF